MWEAERGARDHSKTDGTQENGPERRPPSTRGAAPAQGPEKSRELLRTRHRKVMFRHCPVQTVKDKQQIKTKKPTGGNEDAAKLHGMDL